MSSEIFYDYQLVKTTLTGESACKIVQSLNPAAGLFDETCSDIYLLFESHCSSNVYPKIPSWSLGFIGTAEMLKDYSDYIASLYDDGMCQSAFIKSGSAWRAYLQGLMGEPHTLSTSVLGKLGFDGCSYPYTSILSHDSLKGMLDSQPKPLIRLYGEFRHAFAVNDHTAIEKMIVISLALTWQSNERRFTVRPWKMSDSEARTAKWYALSDTGDQHLVA